MTVAAGGHLDRDRLAGEHAGVDRGGALDQDAVDRDLLARADPEQVADDDRLERDVLLATVGDAPGGRGLRPDEPPDRASRAGPWPGAPASARAGPGR